MDGWVAMRKLDKNERIDSCNTSFKLQSQPIAADLNEKQSIGGKINPTRFRFSNIEKLNIAGRCRFEDRKKIIRD